MTIVLVGVLFRSFMVDSKKYFDRRYFDQPRRQLVGGLMEEKKFTLESIGLTKNWITIGNPRTATTVQFMALNAFGWVLCGYDNVVTGFTQSKWMGTKMANATMYNNTCLSITKSHKPAALMDALNSKQPVTFFTTSSEKKPQDLEKVYPGVKFAYVQEFERMVEKNGLSHVLKEYASIFHLEQASAEVVSNVHEWLDLWDVTRICCGAQMSLAWRQHLHALNGTDLSAMNPGTHPCQEHDLLQVEKNLTALEKPLFGRELTRVGSCDCSVGATIKDQLPFNSKNYDACKGPLDKLIELEGPSEPKPTPKAKPKPKPKPQRATNNAL